MKEQHPSNAIPINQEMAEIIIEIKKYAIPIMQSIAMIPKTNNNNCAIAAIIYSITYFYIYI